MINQEDVNKAYIKYAKGHLKECRINANDGYFCRTTIYCRVVPIFRY